MNDHFLLDIPCRVWYYKDIIKEGLLDRKVGLRATASPKMRETSGTGFAC